MFLDNGNFKINLKTDINEIEIRVNKESDIEKFNNNIGLLKKMYPDYKFYVNLDNKFKLDNLQLNEITKLSNHVNQNVKILIQIKEITETKTKNGKYMYTIISSLPGKRKYLTCKMFIEKPLNVQNQKYYIVDGKISVGDPKFIKKNKRNLGKEIDLFLSILSIEEYVFDIKNEKKYEISRAELHLHTKYSKNDAFIDINDIEKAFDENKLHALAITDHGCVSSFIPFINSLKSKYKDLNKKIILGCEFYTYSQKEYNDNISKEITKLNKELDKIIEENYDKEIENKEQLLKEYRTSRDSAKKIYNRKTISEEEKLKNLDLYIEMVDKIKDIQEEIKIIKEDKKNNEINLTQYKIKIKELEDEYDKNNNIERDHLTVLLSSEDIEEEYNGEMIKINKGLVELYKLISKSYSEHFSIPTDKQLKKQGKRPMISYEEIFNEKIRKYFKITSACAFGKHMKLAVEEKWDDFRKWIHNLDAVEIQPSWNNSYMIEHDEYKNIKTIEDVYRLHKKIYKVCKEEGVPCIITSDAHVNDKEDRIFRSVFKEGYISAIKNKVGEIKNNEKSGEEDFSIDKQPFIMSYNDVIEDYTKQGFTKEEIKEMIENTNKLADSCSNAFDITILPNKLFIPDFPGVDCKTEVPRLAWDFAIKKWSKDGTKEGIDQTIRERLQKELDAIALKGYEVLYYIAYWMCRKSEEMGYIVGSRGSAGSMLLTYCLQVGENNTLPPHYYCKECHNVEWVDTELVGLDLEDKPCEECGGCIMIGDGLNIEAQNFVGYQMDKTPDIDLNFSEVVQTEIHKQIIEVFGKDNAIKSGTQSFYQADALIKDVFSHIPNIKEKVKNEEFDIDYMANEIKTMRTTGDHPGGVLVKPNNIPFEFVTPLVYVADDGNKKTLSSFIDYHSIESNLIKLDALGHSDPTMLKELQDLTGIDFKKIKFNNKELYESILNPEIIGITDKSKYPFPATTLGISEMNTEFTMNMLSELKPKNITDLIYFSGLSHGTNVWNGNVQRDLIISGERKINECIPVRDIIFQQLTKKYNFEPEKAFIISESVRKGKGIKKWEEELVEKCPYWYIDIMKQISYLFPKAHAASYVMNAIRILYYKIYYPQAFYTSAINRYGINDNNNSTFDYIKFFKNINTIEDLNKWKSYISHSTDNPAKEKSQKRISDLLWEMKLRGFEIHKPDFSAEPTLCTTSKRDENVILLPLKSISGVGEVAALDASIAYKEYGDKLFEMTREELSQLTIFDKEKQKNKKAFGKKFLDAYFD